MVTVTAQDADANRAAGDRNTLTFQVTVLDNPTVAASPTVADPDTEPGARLTLCLARESVPAALSSPRGAA